MISSNFWRARSTFALILSTVAAHTNGLGASWKWRSFDTSWCQIQNEFQARHLVGLGPEKILAAGLKAAELAGAGELTAGHIRRAVTEVGGGTARPV